MKSVLFSVAALLFVGPAIVTADESSLLNQVASADGTTAGDKAASNAVRKLQSLASSKVTAVLDAFPGSTSRGNNWLRALAADVCDNGNFPKAELTSYFADRTQDADARYVAFQLLIQHEPEAKSVLLKDAETDPSLPIRFLKIASMLAEAKTNAESAEELLRSVIANGRAPKQLERAAAALEDLGVEVDLAGELGMMRSWSLIGPFDNTDSKHFDTAYRVETAYLDGLSPLGQESDKGKHGDVAWQNLSSDDDLGMVNLNPPMNNEKDGVAYLFTKFSVDGADQGIAQARLGCVTANKVWINGRLVISNEVYHSGERIDQYIGTCELNSGENTILLKIFQNAQTQPWAQDWQFQFRLTRPDGKAIQAKTLERIGG